MGQQIAIAQLNNNARLLSKIITSTRDAGAAGGNVAYTGVGFRPTSVHALSVVDGTLYNSKGFTDSSKAGWTVYQSAANVYYVANTLVTYSNQSGWAQNGFIATFDTDGFTMTWTRVGTPTAGTIKLYFICYR